MLRLLGIVTFLTAVYTHGAEGSFASQQSSTEAAYVAGRVLVGVEGPTGGIMAAAAALPVSGMQPVSVLHGNTLIVNITDGTSVEDKVAQLNSTPGVSFAEPDYLRYTSQRIPNDPRYGQVWSMAKVGAPSAWGSYTGSRAIRVCHIDTGVDYNHVDLRANIHPKWRLNTIAGNHDPMDDNGHGTHTAGILGAVGNNKRGVVGVNWQVRIVPCKFSGADGSGAVSDAIKCMNWCAAKGIKIMTASYGSKPGSQAEYNAVQAASLKGVLLVAAAGNNGANLDVVGGMYPASYSLPNILSVAASDQCDFLAPFSNYGSSQVHIAAPGDGIMSTWPGNQYALLDGTSMATPLVAGSAALLLGASGSSLDAVQLKQLLLDTVDQPAALAGKLVSQGRLNLMRAISQLRPGIPAVPLVVPAPSTLCSLILWSGASMTGPSVTKTFQWNTNRPGLCHQTDVKSSNEVLSAGMICVCFNANCQTVHQQTTVFFYSNIGLIPYDLNPSTSFCPRDAGGCSDYCGIGFDLPGPVKVTGYLICVGPNAVAAQLSSVASVGNPISAQPLPPGGATKLLLPD